MAAQQEQEQARSTEKAELNEGCKNEPEKKDTQREEVSKAMETLSQTKANQNGLNRQEVGWKDDKKLEGRKVGSVMVNIMHVACIVVAYTCMTP